MDGETEAGVEREVESFVLIPKRPRNFSDGRPVVALGTFGKNWARDREKFAGPWKTQLLVEFNRQGATFLSTRERFQQHSHHILSHDFSDLLLGESLLKQSVRYQHPAAGIERRGHRAIEIRTERHMVHTDHRNRVSNRLYGGVRIGAARRCIPQANSDYAAGL